MRRIQYDAGRLAQLIDTMPDLLATGHAATATHHPAAYAQITACYTVASETLNKICGGEGHEQTAAAVGGPAAGDPGRRA